MALAPDVEKLKEQFFEAMMEATVPLQNGPDREITFQALIAAAELLKERFAQELDELRQEGD